MVNHTFKTMQICTRLYRESRKPFQLTFTYLKPTIETLEKAVKYFLADFISLFSTYIRLKMMIWRCEICSLLTIKDDRIVLVFFVNTEHILFLFLVFILLTLNK